jgi:hypothetical protein
MGLSANVVCADALGKTKDVAAAQINEHPKNLMAFLILFIFALLKTFLSAG